MIITNLTSNTYYIGSQRLDANPATVTVTDYNYNNGDLITKQINYLDETNAVSVASPPSGYPRTLGDSSSSPATSAALNSSDSILSVEMEIFV